MNRKLLTAIMAIAAMTALNSCNDDSLEKAYEEGVCRSGGQVIDLLF